MYPFERVLHPRIGRCFPQAVQVDDRQYQTGRWIIHGIRKLSPNSLRRSIFSKFPGFAHAFWCRGQRACAWRTTQSVHITHWESHNLSTPWVKSLTNIAYAYVWLCFCCHLSWESDELCKMRTWYSEGRPSKRVAKSITISHVVITQNTPPVHYTLRVIRIWMCWKNAVGWSHEIQNYDQ